MPLFTEAVNALVTFSKSQDLKPEDRVLVEAFINNNSRRKRNIETNFLNGRRSNLLPDDEVDGSKKLHA